ncbi:hypothetical protein [Cellulomonas sp. SG140]|uniref:hypothetical protein n=1 Tax=Cellulomonas sp. SG140 TaxID=2976536 RepID=UPI0021E797AB|nr:hypothetical protein [Cellulomonas sp. SG140]
MRTRTRDDGHGAATAKRHAPAAVLAAAVLTGLFTVAFLVEAGITADILFGHKAGLAHAAAVADRGAATVLVLFLVAAGWSVVGTARLLRGQDVRAVAIPLGAVVLIGIPGEIADAIGTASGSSLAIGAGIVAAAGLTLALLFTPAARAWRRAPAPRGPATPTGL